MAASQVVPPGFRAEVVASDKSRRAQRHFNTLSAAKDWAARQSTEDGATVRVVQFTEQASRSPGLVSAGDIYEFENGQWVRIKADTD